MKSPNSTPKDSFAPVAKEILLPYQRRFDVVFSNTVESLGDDIQVRRAMEYAIRSGGKRLRPAIVWMCAEAQKSPLSVDLAALAVEFFHTSSLIMDDLPCMDNDDFRRGVPTTHKVFPEAVAVMASFALTAAGFELITRISLPKEHENVVLKPIYRTASLAIGLPGLIGGQQLDLEPKGLDVDHVFEIIDRKTGALFDVCFVFGWLFGGGSLERLEDVQSMSKNFGRAFQILDDLDDLEQDLRAPHTINYAVLFGVDRAKQQIRENVSEFCRLAELLGMQNSPLVALTRMMAISSSG